MSKRKIEEDVPSANKSQKLYDEDLMDQMREYENTIISKDAIVKDLNITKSQKLYNDYGDEVTFKSENISNNNIEDIDIELSDEDEDDVVFFITTSIPLYTRRPLSNTEQM